MTGAPGGAGQAPSRRDDCATDVTKRRATDLAEFKNPQQEPGMERRLLLVFALTFLVIMLFQPLLKKYRPAASGETGEFRRRLPRRTRRRLPSQAPMQRPTAPSASAKKKAPASAPLQATSESETVIENDVYRIVFTNRGGAGQVVGAEEIHRRQRRSAGTGE